MELLLCADCQVSISFYLNFFVCSIRKKLKPYPISKERLSAPTQSTQSSKPVK